MQTAFPKWAVKGQLRTRRDSELCSNTRPQVSGEKTTLYTAKQLGTLKMKKPDKNKYISDIFKTETSSSRCQGVRR